jgi:hypothetical protein
LVENKITDLAQSIHAEKATFMKDITHHAPDAVVLQLGNRQPTASPDHYVVGQTAKPHHYVLDLKALFAAFGQAQSLLFTLREILQ